MSFFTEDVGISGATTNLGPGLCYLPQPCGPIPSGPLYVAVKGDGLYLSNFDGGQWQTPVRMTGSDGNSWQSQCQPSLLGGMTLMNNVLISTVYCAYVDGTGTLGILQRASTISSWTSFSLGIVGLNPSLAWPVSSVQAGLLTYAFADASGNVSWFYGTYGGAWSKPAAVGGGTGSGAWTATTEFGPTLQAFNDGLFCMYPGATDGNLRYAILQNLQSNVWSPEYILPGCQSRYAPGLAVFGTRLFCVYVDPSTDLYYVSTADGINWTSPQSISGSAGNSPRLCFAPNNVLICVHRAYDSSTELYWCRAPAALPAWSSAR
jgi:hypothetical protein